ncbi:MAG: HD domain-containing protein, partial [Chloroflexi bacterium]|nr:HD domain-containing protein [Chloroflexota bacterium]
MMRSSMTAGSSRGGPALFLTRGGMPPRPGGTVNRRSTPLSTEVEALAEGVFRRYRYPARLAQHCRLVGRVALLLAERCGADAPTVGLAGHLHDIGRSPLVAADPREHNELSALVLEAEGLGGCGGLALRHPVYAVLDERTRPRTLPEMIVYYADRRAGMAIVPMEERISETAARHPRFAEGIERSRPFAREI